MLYKETVDKIVHDATEMILANLMEHGYIFDGAVDYQAGEDHITGIISKEVREAILLAIAGAQP